MDVALCTLDNLLYDVATFENLGMAAVSYYRRHLVCPDCHGQAFYRRRASDGQSACFGARPHLASCPWWARNIASSERVLLGGEFIPADESIEIDFDYGGWHLPLDNLTAPAHPWSLPTLQARPATTRRRLSTLLSNLMYNPAFAQSTQRIAVGDDHLRVCDLFARFDTTTLAMGGEYHGFWGLVSDANHGGNEPPSLWLNSGGRQDLSIVIDAEQQGDFCQRWPFFDFEALAGACVLVFGTLRVSSLGKKYVAVNDIDALSINLLGHT